MVVRRGGRDTARSPLHHSCTDYERDEAFQLEYAQAASEPEAWAAFGHGIWPATSSVPGRRDAFHAENGAKGRELTNIERHNVTRAEVCVWPCARMLGRQTAKSWPARWARYRLGARLARLTSDPDLMLSDGEACCWATSQRLDSRPCGRGVATVPERLRYRGLRAPARHDGRRARSTSSATRTSPPSVTGPGRRVNCSGSAARQATASTTRRVTGCHGTRRGVREQGGHRLRRRL